MLAVHLVGMRFPRPDHHVPVHGGKGKFRCHAQGGNIGFLPGNGTHGKKPIRIKNGRFLRAVRFRQHVKRGKGVFHQFPKFRGKLFHTFQQFHRSRIFQCFRFNCGIIHILRGMREQVHEHRAILRRDASAVHERALNRPQERQNKRGNGPHRNIATNDFRAAHRLEQQEAFPFVIDAGSLDFIQHGIMLNEILKFRRVCQEKKLFGRVRVHGIRNKRSGWWNPASMP